LLAYVQPSCRTSTIRASASEQHCEAALLVRSLGHHAEVMFTADDERTDDGNNVYVDAAPNAQVFISFTSFFCGHAL